MFEKAGCFGGLNETDYKNVVVMRLKNSFK